MAKSPMGIDEKHDGGDQGGDGGRPLLFFLGFALLGVALVFVLFAEDLSVPGFFGGEADTGEQTVLQSIPATEGTAVVAQESGTGRMPEAGQAAPNFTLADLEGNEVSLAAFRGRPVIINFWATWCGPCRIEMPELQRAYEERQEEGLAILAVNMEESPDMVRRFFYDDLRLTFTPLLDQDGEVANRYAIFNLPTTYFVDPEGTIAAVHRGPLTGGQIDGYLEETVAGEG